MKRVLPSVLAVVLLVLSLVGCSRGISNSTDKISMDDKAQQASSSNQGNKKNIALVMKTLTNPFFNEMEKGIEPK